MEWVPTDYDLAFCPTCLLYAPSCWVTWTIIIQTANFCYNWCQFLWIFCIKCRTKWLLHSPSFLHVTARSPLLPVAREETRGGSWHPQALVIRNLQGLKVGDLKRARYLVASWQAALPKLSLNYLGSKLLLGKYNKKRKELNQGRKRHYGTAGNKCHWAHEEDLKPVAK